MLLRGSYHMNKKSVCINKGCLATKSPDPFALSCVPWLISPQVCRKHMWLFTEPYRVCVCVFSLHSIYIILQELQDSASQKCTLVLRYVHKGFHPDFITTGQSDRWERLSWNHNLSLSLSAHTHTWTQSPNLMLWLRLCKNNNTPSRHNSLRLDIDVFSFFWPDRFADHN